MAIIGINIKNPNFQLAKETTIPINDGAINIPIYPADETIPTEEPISLLQILPQS